MYIRRLLDHPYSYIIFSTLLGFGLATILFRKTCNDKECYAFRGPSISDIKNKNFKTNDKCYEYIYHHSSCNNSDKKIIDFKNTTMRNDN